MAYFNHRVAGYFHAGVFARARARVLYEGGVHVHAFTMLPMLFSNGLLRRRHRHLEITHEGW